MCLIAYRKDPNDHLPDDIIDRNLEVNDDGFGIAWRRPSDNKLMYIKYGPEQHAEFRKQLKKIDKSPAEYVAHFRMGTRGKKDESNAHPFVYKETEKNEAGEDVGVLVFHNGVIQISGDSTTSDMCDTRIFTERVLAHLQPKWYNNIGAQYLVEAFIGYSRLLIWPSDGDPVRLDGGNQWTQQGGIWYSTTPARKSYGSTSGGKYTPASTGNSSSGNTGPSGQTHKHADGCYYSGATCSNGLAVDDASDDADDEYGSWAYGSSCGVNQSSKADDASGETSDETTDAESDHAGASWWDKTLSALEREWSTFEREWNKSDAAEDRLAKGEKGLVRIQGRGGDFDGLTWEHAGHPIYPIDEPVPDSTGEVGGQCECRTCDTIGDYFSMNGTVFIDIGHKLLDDDDDGENVLMSEDFMRESALLLPVDGQQLLLPAGNRFDMPEMAATT